MILYSAVVSRHHVELRRVGVHWELTNLGTNGTYLDGKRITQGTVTDGAIIRLARSGPNIQIRMGEAAFKELSETMTNSRAAHQRSDLPLAQTDITKQNSGDEEPEEPDIEPETKHGEADSASSTSAPHSSFES